MGSAHLTVPTTLINDLKASGYSTKLIGEKLGVRNNVINSWAKRGRMPEAPYFMAKHLLSTGEFTLDPTVKALPKPVKRETLADRMAKDAERKVTKTLPSHPENKLLRDILGKEKLPRVLFIGRVPADKFDIIKEIMEYPEVGGTVNRFP